MARVCLKHRTADSLSSVNIAKILEVKFSFHEHQLYHVLTQADSRRDRPGFEVICTYEAEWGFQSDAFLR